MEKPRWSTKFFKRNILIKLFMKVQIELFGASREFSNQNYLEFDIENDSTIKDIRKNLIDYLIKNFNGNENFKKIVETSAFCSENNNIINDNYKILKDQKIGIIPPIGGG